MKTVIVLRHAKSDWGDVGLRDFDRGLNDRGCKAAGVMGRWAALQGLTFQAILASPAARVVETLGRFRAAYGDCPAPDYDLRLYLAEATVIAEALAGANAAAQCVLVAGHSPGLEELILASVADDGRSALRDSVEIKFPTAALAVLDFDITDWADLTSGFVERAKLRAFVRPRDLDPALGPDQR